MFKSKTKQKHFVVGFLVSFFLAGLVLSWPNKILPDSGAIG
jgi:hypothetical protein